MSRVISECAFAATIINYRTNEIENNSFVTGLFLSFAAIFSFFFLFFIFTRNRAFSVSLPHTYNINTYL